MTDYGHLGKKALTVIEAGPAERITFIREPHWIGYTKAKEILDQLDDLRTHPKVHRMPCLLLLGETNNGKTVLLRHFEELNPVEDTRDSVQIKVPVMVVQAPPVPDESRFYEAILDGLFAPYRRHDSAARKQAQVMAMLGKLKLRVLVIDEIHHLIAGDTNRHRSFLNVIKYMTNELEIAIVGAGIKTAFVAMQTEPQMENRFRPVVLPRWEMGEEYLRLLASFERLLPLREPSYLVDDPLATKLLSLIDGKIGELSGLLTMAAIRAIQSGQERIDARLIDQTGWRAPGDRKLVLDGIQ